MSILAIDPGPTQSAWVEFDGEKVIEHGISPNREVRSIVSVSKALPLAIEGIQCFGMPAGKELFETCIWIGRFIELHGGGAALIYRSDVKMHLCHSMRAKDPMVRQALIDRFGGKAKAIGKKKSQGPLYGIKTHEWQALALAVYWFDKECIDAGTVRQKEPPMKNVKCMKCGHVAPESEFTKGRDFCQVLFISGCPKCDNHQSPGDASMRMFGGPRPFEYVRASPTTDNPVETVLHNAGEAS